MDFFIFSNFVVSNLLLDGIWNIHLIEYLFGVLLRRRRFLRKKSKPHIRERTKQKQKKKVALLLINSTMLV